MYINKMLANIVIVALVHLVVVKGGPPVFEEPIVNVIVEEGDTLFLYCTASGDPLPQYKWYDEYGDDLSLNPSLPLSIDHGQNMNSSFSFVVINNTIVNYTGSYVCGAHNVHGLRTKVFQVRIILKTEKVYIEEVKVSNITECEVAFFIVSIGNKEEFDVEFTEKVLNKTQLLHFSSRNIVIQGLTPSGEYRFRFSPTKQAGVARNWTNTMTVVLLPSVPEVILNGLNEGVLTIEWTRNFDDFKRDTIDKHQLTYMTVQMYQGNSWVYSSCNITIEIPQCSTSRYTLANLSKRTFYEIQLKAHTVTGYGKPYRTKIFLP